MKSFRFSVLVIAVAAAFLASCSGRSARHSSGNHNADYVFTGGKIYTVNEKQPWAEAVAVKGNKIVFVGSAVDAAKFVGADTDQVNLEGKMLLPGFVSAHEHLIASGWMSLGVNIGAAQSKQEYLKLVKEYADANPNEKFIRGIGWNPTAMGGDPTAADLDSIVSDRPVFLLDFTIHDMWMNSKAMEMGGVDKDTKDAVPGLTYWVRDSDGNPTGYAKEFAWLEAYMKAGAWEAEKMISESQTKLYDMAAELGYTAYINQGLVTPNIKSLKRHHEDTLLAMGILEKLQKKGELKLRTYLQVLYKNEKEPVEELVRYAKKLRERFDSDVLGISGIKVHPEGVFTSHASVMLKPWKDKPDKVAKRGVSAERTHEIIMAGNKAGFDVAVHTDGSKTNRVTIDSFLKAKEAGHTDARNSLHHYANVSPEDQQRVIKYKIPVNLTPIWATTWSGGLDSALEILGKERVTKNFQQIRTAVDGGTSVSISADVPSTNPELMGALTQMEAAITRRDPSNPKDTRVFPPMSQALTLEQALRSVTIEPAWQARMEDKLGTIEIGKYADLVILDKNLFDVKPDQIADVNIVATMMNGRFTYQAAKMSSQFDEAHEKVFAASVTVSRHFVCEVH